MKRRSFSYVDFWHRHSAEQCKRYSMPVDVSGWIDPPHHHDGGRDYRTLWTRIHETELVDYCHLFRGVDVFTSLNFYELAQKPASDEHNLAHYDQPFDFDSEGDYELALKDAMRCIDFLREIGVQEWEHFCMAFSGSKGFATRLPYQLLDQEPLPAVTGCGNHIIARSIAQRIAKEAALTTLDLSVYTKRRQWRIDGSLHTKKGLYRIHLLRADLERGIDKILEWATESTTEKINRDAIVANPTLAVWYREFRKTMEDEAAERRHRRERHGKKARNHVAEPGGDPPACSPKKLDLDANDGPSTLGKNGPLVLLKSGPPLKVRTI
jgi:hypothetical protein